MRGLMYTKSLNLNSACSSCRRQHLIHRQRASQARVSAVKPMETTTFNKASDNFHFAPILNGCWQLAGGHGQEVYENILEKLEAHAAAGFTTFDTADIYGPSERILGEFQRKWVASGHPPVQIFTKFCPNIYQGRPSPAFVENSIRKSLANLQVSQLDLVQVHWWDYGINGLVDCMLALKDLQNRGLIKHIGTTNMDVKHLKEIVDAGVPVVANQVQFSLLDRRPLNGMLQYCEDNGIKLFTYGSLGGGLLTDKYVEEPKPGLFGGKKYSNIDLNTSSLKMYWNIAKAFGGQELYRELLAVLRQVADKHDATVANVSLRWVMQQGTGTSVHPIVGLRSTKHVEDNKKALALSLDGADMEAINSVLARAKGPNGDIYSFERGF